MGSFVIPKTTGYGSGSEGASAGEKKTPSDMFYDLVYHGDYKYYAKEQKN